MKLVDQFLAAWVRYLQLGQTSAHHSWIYIHDDDINKV